MNRLWHVPGILVALLVVGAPLAAWLGAGPAAFYPFMIGVLIGLVSTITLAGAAAFASTTGREWRSAAVRATVAPLVLTLTVLAIGGMPGGHPIHDVTTDLEDTLRFTPDVAALEALPMPRQDVLAIQAEIYPEIQPLILEEPGVEVFARALETARGTAGWEVIKVDEAAGRIEAVATSTIFRFADDVVIRVEPDADGTRVDVRSRSRMGQSGLGANAARIGAYLDALAGAG